VDPALAKLIRRAAAARRMDPNDFLAILIDCDTRESSRAGANAETLLRTFGGTEAMKKIAARCKMCGAKLAR
jgi:hypothetical protein